TVDPASHRIGNIKFVFPRRVMNNNVSTYLNCGSTMTGLLADQGRVTASLLTEIAPDSKGGTSVTTTLQATAKRVDGTNTDAVDCGSTGELEERLRKIITLRATNLRGS